MTLFFSRFLALFLVQSRAYICACTHTFNWCFGCRMMTTKRQRWWWWWCCRSFRFVEFIAEETFCVSSWLLTLSLSRFLSQHARTYTQQRMLFAVHTAMISISSVFFFFLCRSSYIFNGMRKKKSNWNFRVRMEFKLIPLDHTRNQQHNFKTKRTKIFTEVPFFLSVCAARFVTNYKFNQSV